jgi:hypothetical protein
MGVIINGGVNIGSGRTLINSPYIAPAAPPVTFNYELKYLDQGPDGTISSISGATFTPPFTPQSGPFTYTATGVATSPVTFGVYIGAPYAGIGVNFANLYKNTILQESIVVQSLTVSIVYQPIQVSSNDNILIDIVFFD